HHGTAELARKYCRRHPLLRAPGTQSLPQSGGKALPIVVTLPEIVSLLCKAFVQVADIPLSGAGKCQQFVASNRNRHWQPRTCPHRISRHRTGAATVAQVVDKYFSNPVFWPHLGDKTLWNLLRHKFRNRFG